MQPVGLKWESLKMSVGPAVQRSKIPGGWLLVFYDMMEMAMRSDSGGSHHSSDVPYGGMAFVPDPDHQWDGNSLP
jgi:hypothetical protein